MPLALKLRGKIYYVRGVVGPPGKRAHVYESTGTGDKAGAEAYRTKREGELWNAAVFGERAVKTFAEAALHHLQRPRKRSERPISPGDAARVRRLISHLGQTRLTDIDQATIAGIEFQICGPATTPATRLRAVWAPARSIMRDAAKQKWCDAPMWDVPAQGKSRTDWRSPADALKLIGAAVDHFANILLFAFGTGARASEIISLTWPDVDLAAGTAILRDTKNGRDRIVKLPPRVVVTLANLPHREGHVFMRPNPRAKLKGQPAFIPYTENGSFKTAWAGACKRAGFGTWVLRGNREVFDPDMPPHSTRHSWATWTYAATKDALRVMHDGDWSSLELVTRYAHLMRQDLVASIADVWGVAHPDLFPANVAERAASVQEMPAKASSAG